MPADARPQRYADFVKSMASPNKKIEKIVGIIKAQILAQLNIIDVASEAGIIFEEDALLNPNFETEEIIKRMQKLLTDLKAVNSHSKLKDFLTCHISFQAGKLLLEE